MPATPSARLRLARAELRAPASLPVVHHLAGQLELAPGTGIQAAEIAPDDLALIEHRGLQLRVGASPRHALAQGIERPPLEPIAPNGFGPHQQSGKHHEREAKQEFALEGHGSNIPLGQRDGRRRGADLRVSALETSSSAGALTTF